jgi:short subunit dehydrogenase-like uncharacterized protein
LEVKEMARNSKRVYQVLYKDGPLAGPQMRELLREEGFEMKWIGAQNAHGKRRIGSIVTADTTYYGLTVKGVEEVTQPNILRES